MKDTVNEHEEVHRCLKHENKQLKSTTTEAAEVSPVDLSPLENDVRCLKYEVKWLKERPVVENITPATVEERSVEPSVDNSCDIESMKDNMKEIEEFHCFLKHEIKQHKSTTT